MSLFDSRPSHRTFLRPLIGAVATLLVASGLVIAATPASAGTLSPSSMPVFSSPSAQITITGTGFLTGAGNGPHGELYTDSGYSVMAGVQISNTGDVNCSTSTTCTIDKNPWPYMGQYYLGMTQGIGVQQQMGTILFNPVISRTFTVVPDQPAAGPLAGGNTIKLNGYGLTKSSQSSGSVSITIGGVPATITMNSSTDLWATVPAGAAAGLVDVVVNGPNGATATYANGYRYLAVSDTPTITSISPAAGSTGGGSVVTITGTNFYSVDPTNGVTIGGTAATQVTVNSTTSITATIPAHAAGTVDVSVTNPAGTGTLTNGYTYSASAPRITSINPFFGPTSGGTSVELTGANLSGVTSVTFGGVPAASFSYSVVTSKITAVSPAHASGSVILAATDPNGSGSASFRYDANPPTVTSVSPTSGSTSGTTSVVITGTDFTGATAVKFATSNATTYSVDSDTQITAVAPSHAAGAVSVSVTNAMGTSTPNTLYTYAISSPTFTSISPTSGSTAGATSVTITGTGFVSGASVTVGGSACTSVSVVSSTSITCTTPAHAAGATSVVITNTDTGTVTGTNAYTFTTPPAPVITTISPSSGPTSGGTTLTLTGTNFTGASSVTIGGILCGSMTVVSSTQITCSTPPGSAGAGAVSVTTPGGTATTAGGFTYALAPTITTMTPTSCTTAGGTVITITGTNLTGATVTVGGTSATISSNNGTTLVFTAPAGSAGATTAVVTTTGGTASQAFTYTSSGGGGSTPAPTTPVSALSPSPTPTAPGTAAAGGIAPSQVLLAPGPLPSTITITAANGEPLQLVGAEVDPDGESEVISSGYDFEDPANYENGNGGEHEYGDKCWLIDGFENGETSYEMPDVKHLEEGEKEAEHEEGNDPYSYSTQSNRRLQGRDSDENEYENEYTEVIVNPSGDAHQYSNVEPGEHVGDDGEEITSIIACADHPSTGSQPSASPSSSAGSSASPSPSSSKSPSASASPSSSKSPSPSASPSPSSTKNPSASASPSPSSSKSPNPSTTAPPVTIEYCTAPAGQYFLTYADPEWILAANDAGALIGTEIIPPFPTFAGQNWPSGKTVFDKGCTGSVTPAHTPTTQPSPPTTVSTSATVDICHAQSGDQSQPYVMKSITAGDLTGNSGHVSHDGKLFPAANWGDIIPAVGTYPGMNWPEGREIWSRDCEVGQVPAVVLPPFPSVTPSVTPSGSPSPSAPGSPNPGPTVAAPRAPQPPSVPIVIRPILPKIGSTPASANLVVRLSNGVAPTTLTIPFEQARRIMALSPALPGGQSVCSAQGTSSVVFFSSLSASLDSTAKSALTRVSRPGCRLRITGYVQPTPDYANDLSLSKRRAKSVHAYLKTQVPTKDAIVIGGKRDIQQRCRVADNRCAIVEVLQKGMPKAHRPAKGR